MSQDSPFVRTARIRPLTVVSSVSLWFRAPEVAAPEQAIVSVMMKMVVGFIRWLLRTAGPISRRDRRALRFLSILFGIVGLVNFSRFLFNAPKNARRAFEAFTLWNYADVAFVIGLILFSVVMLLVAGVLALISVDHGQQGNKLEERKTLLIALGLALGSGLILVAPDEQRLVASIFGWTMSAVLILGYGWYRLSSARSKA